MNEKKSIRHTFSMDAAAVRAAFFHIMDKKDAIYEGKRGVSFCMRSKRGTSILNEEQQEHYFFF